MNAPPNSEGVYEYCCHQIEYVKVFVKNGEELTLKVGLKNFKDYDTPALANDSKFSEDVDEVPGYFAPFCAKLVCAILYIARSSRPDILYATCRLTRFLTRWTRRQDAWLLRLLGYLRKTSKMKLNFKIHPPDFESGGDGIFENWHDADLGGDKSSRRSTTGGLGRLKGSKSNALVWAMCKRQGATALSTPDSETLGLVVVAKRVIPLHMTLQRLLKRELPHRYYGDNSATERVVNTGLSAALSYLKRTVGISLTWCKENLSRFLFRTESDENISDVFTKALDKDKFEKYREMLGVF